jgi:hypothetical protein
MLTHVEFRSDLFPAIEGEEEMINPGRWGKRLADFLRDGLVSRGFVVSEPINEDWGWCLLILGKPFSLWIGCGNYGDDGFLCFIEPSKPRVWRYFRRVDTRSEIQALHDAMDGIFSENEGICDKRWWTYEEFNFPSRQATTL